MQPNSKMAAPMRGLLAHAQKTVPRLCCRQIPLVTKSVAPATTTSTTSLVTSALSVQGKFYHVNRPSWNAVLPSFVARPHTDVQPTRAYSLFTGTCTNAGTFHTGLLQRLLPAPGMSSTLQSQPSRTVILYSRNSGKKKTVKAVVSRFYRFSNGLWLRTIAGRNKKRWKKSSARRRRTKWHVFCNKTQSKMLDRMVTTGWKERRYYPDDPFEPFQERNFKGLNFFPGPEALRRRKDS